MWPEAISLAALAVRLLLAAVFLSAGLAKIGSRERLARDIAGYRLLPARLASPAARVLPPLELLCGAALALGLLPRPTAIAAGALLLLFSAAVALNLLRGRRIPCGCGGADDRTISWWLALRDAAGAVLAVGLCLWPATLLAIPTPGEAPTTAPAAAATTGDGLAVLTLVLVALAAARLLQAVGRLQRAQRAVQARSSLGGQP